MSLQPVINRPGDLNPVFNGGRVDLLHTGSAPILVWMEAVADGGLLVLSTRDSVSGFYLTKFTPLGSLDPAFAQGIGYLHFNSEIAGFRTRLHLLGDGRFIVVGGLGDSLLASCFNADGSLDTGYGVEGHALVRVTELVVREGEATRWTFDPARGDDVDELPSRSGNVYSVADPDGVYWVFSVSWGGNQLMTVVVRLNAVGTLDTTFNQSGYQVVTLAGTDFPYNFPRAAVLQADRQLVVLGYLADIGSAFMTRLTADGQSDYSFGGTGDDQGLVRVSTEVMDRVRDLWVGDTGDLKVIGRVGINNGDTVAVVLGYTANGAIDSTFNAGQPLRTEVEPGRGYWISGAFYGGGDKARMVFSTTVSRPQLSVAAVRLRSDGEFDRDFGNNGIASFPTATSPSGRPVVMRVLPNHDMLLGRDGDIYWLLGELER